MTKNRELSVLGVLTAMAMLAAAATACTAEEKNQEGAQPNGLQALQEAFNKGVTSTPVEIKDLPKEVSNGAAKARPGATIVKAQRLEIKHTLQYVAFDKPQVQTYQAVLIQDGKRTRLQIAPDSRRLNAQPLPDNPVDATKKGDRKEIEIPDKAAKAVKAIKELYAGAVVEAITTEVYQDPSGTVDVLTYEIEFVHDGMKHEMVASPAGVIPHLWKPITEKDLPKEVAATVAKEGGKIESLSQFEFRAGLQFASLDQPRIVFQLNVEKDGAASKLSLRADGTAIPPPVRPGPKNRSYVGLSLESGSSTVSQVMDDSPAHQAGIKPGDKLLKVGDTKINTVAELLKVVQSAEPGRVIKVELQRGDERLTVNLKLAALPE